METEFVVHVRPEWSQNDVCDGERGTRNVHVPAPSVSLSVPLRMLEISSAVWSLSVRVSAHLPLLLLLVQSVPLGWRFRS